MNHRVYGSPNDSPKEGRSSKSILHRTTIQLSKIEALVPEKHPGVQSRNNNAIVSRVKARFKDKSFFLSRATVSVWAVKLTFPREDEKG